MIKVVNLEDIKAFIDDDEIEYLENSIKSEGYESSDFKLFGEVDELPIRRVGVVKGTVRITRISTGIVKTYDAESSPKWLEKFDSERLCCMNSPIVLAASVFRGVLKSRGNFAA